MPLLRYFRFTIKPEDHRSFGGTVPVHVTWQYITVMYCDSTALAAQHGMHDVDHIYALKACLAALKALKLRHKVPVISRVGKKT